jgi:hypothetical protein
LNKLKLQRILTEEGADRFIKAMSRNKTGTTLLVQIIEHYLQDFNRPTVQKDLENPQWPLMRAYRDGGRYYLQQLLELLKEK